MNRRVMFSSNSPDWETPAETFKKLDVLFNFTLDPCASSKNKKCEKFYTKEDDGLSISWSNERVFMNPPYGRELPKWIKKANEESNISPGTIVVGLLPARTDTRWFHDYIYGQAQIYFIKGRIKFSNSKNSAPFPSMIVVWGDTGEETKHDH